MSNVRTVNTKLQMVSFESHRINSKCKLKTFRCCMLQEMSKMIKTQELEIARQAAIISQQGEVISKLETSDYKSKQEVLEILEAGKAN